MAPVIGVKGASGLAMAAGMLVLVVLAKSGLERRGVAEEPAELLEGPPRNIPSAFAEEAERTRIETAIRRAASKLQEERGEKGRLERVYAEEAAKAEAEGKKADKLLGKGKAAASQAVVKRAEYEVENSKADTDEKSVGSPYFDGGCFLLSLECCGCRHLVS